MTAVAGSAGDAPDDLRDPDDQAPLDARSRRGLGILVATVLGATLLAHTPGWLGGDTLRPVGESVVHAMGVEMNWIVFAPNPPDRSTFIEGRVTFEDGGTTVWRPPDPGPWLEMYAQYRWDKSTEFTTTIASDWAPDQLAASIARRTEADTGRRVRQVELVVLRKPIEAIGGDWVEDVIAVHRGAEAP